MQRKRLIYLLGLASLLLISGCAAMQSPESSSPDYYQIKQMVQDIMQTDEGKKAIQESLKDGEMKKQLMMDGEEMKMTIQSTLLSPKAVEGFQKVMEDPKFTSQLAKSMQKENAKLLKASPGDYEIERLPPTDDDGDEGGSSKSAISGRSHEAPHQGSTGSHEA
jgi:spore germination protein D